MSNRNHNPPSGLENLRRGDFVTVRGLDEIQATLDADGCLEGLPFMAEMVPCCGRSFRVHRRAEKTCVEGFGMRAMDNTVFLDGLRCDGVAHDGCQRGCLFFWKKAWLTEEGAGKQVASGQWPVASDPESLNPQIAPSTKDGRFFCQSTELARATSDYPPGRLRHDLHDLKAGEMTLGRFVFLYWIAIVNRLWLLLYGRRFHDITGCQTKNSAGDLNLQAGEWVEVRSRKEIEATLDAQSCNQGLRVEPEMVRHCGRRYRVASPLRKIIAEETGQMVTLRNTVILEGVACEGICLLNCPRANLLYWREIWLKRV
jgi:hypothetical protein